MAELVDIAIVLACDNSSSISDNNFSQMREALAYSVRQSEVQIAATGGKEGKVAVCVVDWASDIEGFRQARIAVPWTVIKNGTDAEAFASLIEAEERSYYGSTHLMSILDFVKEDVWTALSAADVEPSFKSVQIITDGIDRGNGDQFEDPGKGYVSNLPSVREEIRSVGVGINAITVGNTDIENFYRQKVIIGTDAFVVPTFFWSGLSLSITRMLIRVLGFRKNQIEKTCNPDPWSESPLEPLIDDCAVPDAPDLLIGCQDPPIPPAPFVPPCPDFTSTARVIANPDVSQEQLEIRAEIVETDASECGIDKCQYELQIDLLVPPGGGGTIGPAGVDGLEGSGCMTVINRDSPNERTMPRFGIAGIADDNFDISTYDDRVVYPAVAPNRVQHSERFVIIQEDLPYSEEGCAVECDLTLANVNFSDTSHQFADIEDGNMNHLVSVETGGVVKIVEAPSGTGTQTVLVKCIPPDVPDLFMAILTSAAPDGDNRWLYQWTACEIDENRDYKPIQLGLAATGVAFNPNERLNTGLLLEGPGYNMNNIPVSLAMVPIGTPSLALLAKIQDCDGADQFVIITTVNHVDAV